jgi:hypothetical protein
MEIYSFEPVLLRPEGVGTWTYLNIPPEISSTFATKGQVRVKGSLNGFHLRSTALPSGDGSQYLVVGKEIRDQIHAHQGDKVLVTIELDLDERSVDIPQDLALALASRPEAKSAFEKMSFFHQKEYVDWVQSAKYAETRKSRIEKTVSGVLAGKNIRQIR